MRQLERTGQAERAIFLRGLNEEERLQTEMELRVADAANEAQADAIRRLYEAKIQSNADETRDKLDKQKTADKAAAEARIAEETRAADAIAKAEADASKAAQREQEKADQEAARALDKANTERIRMMEESARIESERISSQAAGITGANTALGTFRFDAYPDSDKKRNDERMVKAL
jgi:membrane protein involved in colicin uptake